MAETKDKSGRVEFPYLGQIGVGIMLVAALAVVAAQMTNWIAAVGISLIIFLASSAVGAAFGFLFAVPRLLSEGQDQAIQPAGSGGDPYAAKRQAAETAAPTLSRRLLRSNTNLERISDWLTTMLVGVGLSQIGSIGTALLGFGKYLDTNAKVFVGPSESASAGALPAIGPMLLIFGLVVGFLCVYVYTRVILSGLFKNAEDILAVQIAPERAPVSEKAAGVVIQEAQVLLQQSDDPVLRAVAGSKEISVGDALSVMFSLLYEPEGYKRIIEMAAGLGKTPAIKMPEYWYYLAAAYGQHHHQLVLSKADDATLQQAKKSTLNAATQAVTLDRSYASRLWAISEPDDTDNDLADFRDDPEFRSIVRRPLTPSKSRR